MARADLMKKLFSNFKHNDTKAFYEVADAIIEDEIKKNHEILANDLKRILYNGNIRTNSNMIAFSPTIPKNKDRDVPLVEIVYPEKYFNELILDKEKINILEAIVKEFINWDVLVANGAYPSSKILFYGPPGCGKTVTAKAIASELGIPLLYVRFDAVVSSLLGETASNIREVFDFAKRDNWVLFFDEFDAIGRSRNDSSEHGEIKRVVNTFLQQLDNFKGRSLVIAATNFEDSLDYALWRRFDETLKFEMPSDKEKFEVFLLNMQRLNGPEHLFENYITELLNFSHSDIEKLCLRVLKKCILDGRKVYSKRDLHEAIEEQKKVVSMRKTSY